MNDTTMSHEEWQERQAEERREERSEAARPLTPAQLEFLTALSTGEFRVLYREDREALRAVLGRVKALETACTAALDYLLLLDGGDGDARTDEERELCDTLRAALTEPNTQGDPE